MTQSPLSGPQDHRVYISASNRFFLALKTFGYSLLGYIIIALVIALIVFAIGALA